MPLKSNPLFERDESVQIRKKQSVLFTRFTLERLEQTCNASEQGSARRGCLYTCDEGIGPSVPQENAIWQVVKHACTRMRRIILTQAWPLSAVIPGPSCAQLFAARHVTHASLNGPLMQAFHIQLTLFTLSPMARNQFLAVIEAMSVLMYL